MLREAKESQEISSQQQNISDKTPPPPLAAAAAAPVRSQKQEELTFSLFFEEYKGTAHLEALEMLSNQSSLKVERSSSSSSWSSSNELLLLKLFDSKRLDPDQDLDEDENELSEAELLSSRGSFEPNILASLLSGYAEELEQGQSQSELLAIVDKVLVAAFRTTSLAAQEVDSQRQLLNEVIKCFALIAASAMQFFHRLAETWSRPSPPSNWTKSSPIDKAHALYSMTRLCIRSITILADDFCKRCKSIPKDAADDDFVGVSSPKNVNQIITDIYLEASNSSTYIGDGFLHFLPLVKFQVLQQESRKDC
jgi:hypothetical protein